MRLKKFEVTPVNDSVGGVPGSFEVRNPWLPISMGQTKSTMSDIVHHHSNSGSRGWFTCTCRSDGMLCQHVMEVERYIENSGR